jgi:hypothetical protein
MLVTPGAAAQKHIACDRGGNQLQFESPQAKLHSIWDNCLVQLQAGLTCAAHSGLPGGRDAFDQPTCGNASPDIIDS